MSRQLSKINQEEKSENNDSAANTNFLKVLNEKMNHNDTSITKLIERVEELEINKRNLNQKVEGFVIQNSEFKQQIEIEKLKTPSPSNRQEPDKTAPKPRRDIPVFDISPPPECTECIDCTESIDCIECVYCMDCIECIDCSDCSDCSDCIDCTDCTYCTDCTVCTDCIDCTNCTDCIDCTDLIDRTDFIYCTDCTDCTDLSNIGFFYCSRMIQIII